MVRNAFFAMDNGLSRVPGTMESRFDSLKEIGYAGLSLKTTDPLHARSVREALETRGMKLYALYVSCPVTSSGVLLPEHFEQLCAAVSGTDAVVWLYNEKSSFKPSDTSADPVAIPGFQKAADMAAGHNVRIALYPHRDYWVESFADAIRVAERVNRSNFGVSFNLCHSLAAGEEEKIPELLRKAGSRLFIVTLNGADSGAPGAKWDRLIRPLGQGTFKITPLLDLLKELKYPGAIGFQAFGIPGDQLEVLRTTMSEWRRLNSPDQD